MPVNTNPHGTNKRIDCYHHFLISGLCMSIRIDSKCPLLILICQKVFITLHHPMNGLIVNGSTEGTWLLIGRWSKVEGKKEWEWSGTSKYLLYIFKVFQNSRVQPAGENLLESRNVSQIIHEIILCLHIHCILLYLQHEDYLTTSCWLMFIHAKLCLTDLRLTSLTKSGVRVCGPDETNIFRIVL